MRYLTLATDYDETIAERATVAPRTLDALRLLRENGRRMVLVTGRELGELRSVFPEHTVFDRIVAENGAVVFDPETREETLLGEPPPEALVQRLREMDMQPLGVGRVIVATREPNEKKLLEIIQELGLEHQLIFNKGAVMVLPSGINKASGLRAALKQMHLSLRNTVAVGDAENDHALLSACEVAVAVQNAVPTLKERADWVTNGARGEGIVELVERLVSTDLSGLEPRLGRHALTLGTTDDDEPVTVRPYGTRLLLCGASGAGKSTLVHGFLERLAEHGYSFCVVDPEGDFGVMPDVLTVGNEQKAPGVDEIVQVLTSDRNVVANLLGVRLEERPLFLGPLLARLMEHRTRTGRPHFIIVDEAHHMLPEGDVRLAEPVANVPTSLLLVTVHPEHLTKRVLEKIDVLVAVGKNARESMRAFGQAAGLDFPTSGAEIDHGEALVWTRERPREIVAFAPLAPKSERHRHLRKYAAGSLGEDKSFYFRGPEGALNLRANNLALFLQMADGVDDRTWLHHLVRHDYSRWIREAIKNDDLAADVEHIERATLSDPVLGRQRVREAIERIYTLPA